MRMRVRGSGSPQEARKKALEIINAEDPIMTADEYASQSRFHAEIELGAWVQRQDDLEEAKRSANMLRGEVMARIIGTQPEDAE